MNLKEIISQFVILAIVATLFYFLKVEVWDVYLVPGSITDSNPEEIVEAQYNFGWTCYVAVIGLCIVSHAAYFLNDLEIEMKDNTFIFIYIVCGVIGTIANMAIYTGMYYLIGRHELWLLLPVVYLIYAGVMRCADNTDGDYSAFGINGMLHSYLEQKDRYQRKVNNIRNQIKAYL